MLDGILGRGFASKCKSLIKVTKSRIEVIRRKRNATLKFLKKDMADLLVNGLDINAYGRAEGLLAELTLSYCYDCVEQSCDFVVKHLSVMEKLRHCPEDCREAVSSLMFAAARFSDLPELRDLRDIFYERYGNSVELFVNQEFVEKLSSKSVTMEKKIQLMRDIASEFSIKWDSQAFEQRMSKTSAPTQDQPKSYGPLHVNDYKYKSINGKDTVRKGDKHGALAKERLDYNCDGYKFLNEKESNVPKTNGMNPRSVLEVPGHGDKPFNIQEETTPKRDVSDIKFQRRHGATTEKHEPWKDDTPLKTVRLGSSSQRKRMESVDGGSKLQDGRENSIPKGDGQETLTHGKLDITSSFAGLWPKRDSGDSLSGCSNSRQSNNANAAREVQEEVYKQKTYYNNAIPPPYTKPNAKPKDSKYGACSDDDVVHKNPSMDNRANPGHGSEKIQQGVYHPDRARQNVGLTRENDGHENYIHPQGDGITNLIPKPRSMRRKHSKSHSSHDDIGNLVDAGAVKRRSRSRRKDDSRRGLQILFDNEHYRNDEEERIIDRLLMHYSKKPSAYEHGKVKRKSKSRHARHEGTEADKSPQHISRDGPDDISEIPHPARSISLPREQTSSSEATKVFTRAASFQPDRSSPARHVHPKLPDYDDLAARFAALKGR